MRDNSGVGESEGTVVSQTREGDHAVAVCEWCFRGGTSHPSFRGPKLRPERYVPFCVEDIMNVLIRKPVLGRKEATGSRIEPPDGALDFGPGGVRGSVR